MSDIIKTNHDLCTGCNRCVRECPMEMANITSEDTNGSIKVEIDHEKCIVCGRCFSVCKHDARYYNDDTERFFEDLSNNVPISIIAAPAIKTNVPNYKKLFTCLKSLGVNKIYDVSLGADICIWAHIRFLEKSAQQHIITQPCPAIVKYCETYKHGLLKNLSPVHSPMCCICVYMKEYEGINDKIAAISPCVAKSHEFMETGLAQYNVTFTKLQIYLELNNIKLPEEESGFDHINSGLGSLFPMPGGLKENIEFFLGKELSIDKAEGDNVYKWLEMYAESAEELLPNIFDVLNCNEGCNIGSACSHSANIFEINRMMDHNRNIATSNRDYNKTLLELFDKKLDLSNFTRNYQTITTSFPIISSNDIEKAFGLLGKNTFEKQNVDCGACGSETCYNMARKIALGVNIPINCVVKIMDDAKVEHAENLVANEQLLFLEKVREADVRIRIMLETNPHINILFKSNFEIIDCNPAAMRFMGFYTKEELIAGFRERFNKSILAIQPDGHIPLTLEEMFEVVIKEETAKFETEIILDGSMKSLNIELKKIPHEDSFAIVAYFFDMTDIHNRELELTRSRELNELQLAKLNLVVQGSKIGLWDMEIIESDPVNPENVFTWSDEFRHMLGFTDESDFPNLLRSWSDRLHPEDKDRTLTAFERHMKDTSGRTPYDVEYRLLKKNGEYAYYRASGETIRDEDGNPLRVAGALMDITETKNMLLDTERQRIEAEAANKAKSAFLSTMSHEIRTPMNAILGITEIQLQSDKLDQSIREAFDRIYLSGDMLLGIINDILDLSKIEAGKLELTTAQYELASLICDTAQLNTMRIGSKPIEFELHVDENLPLYLLGDELRIKQILNNVLSNAFKYTASGNVKFSIGAENNNYGIDGGTMTLIFTVSDTGQGMTKEQVDKLFDEYSRFNEEANRTTEGTGLGMSILRKLINMMGGEIFVDSTPGKGSTFTIHLPQTRSGSEVLGRESAENLHMFRTSSRAQMKRVQIAREPMPYGSVLIVDDVETNIFVAIGLLAPYELAIDTADSGFAAVDKIKDGKVYDIVFMDHMMPKMDGIETTKLLRNMGYTHPIVALTANAVAGQTDVFLSNGFDGFISKPIDIRQLNAVLNKLIRDKQPPEVLAAAREQTNNKEAAKEADQSSSAGRPNEDGRSNEAVPSQDKAVQPNEVGRSSSSGPVAKKHYPAISPRFAEILVRDTSKAITVLEGINEKQGVYSEDDMRNFGISVHGMKSALAAVGRKELSDFALKLELAGREKNTKLMEEETPVFINALQELVKELKPKE